MPLLSHPAFGPRAALIYITVGSLLDIWVGVWYFIFVRGQADVSPIAYFLLIGLFLTGITLLAIGLMLGRIGQAARRAELPPPEALPVEAAVQQKPGVVPAAAQPVITVGSAAPGLPVTAAPVAPAMPATAPPGYTPVVTNR